MQTRIWKVTCHNKTIKYIVGHPTLNATQFNLPARGPGAPCVRPVTYASCSLNGPGLVQRGTRSAGMKYSLNKTEMQHSLREDWRGISTWNRHFTNITRADSHKIRIYATDWPLHPGAFACLQVARTYNATFKRSLARASIAHDRSMSRSITR